MIKVNTNISAMKAAISLSNSQRNSDQGIERLAGGLRINTAADDAAGLAIASKMTSQIIGLRQGIRNADDAISMVQIAEGATVEISNMLQRMRELAIQAVSDSNTSKDRVALDNEFQQLSAEVDRIANNTEWNVTSLLNSASAGSITLQIGANAGQTITTDFGNFRANTGLGVLGVNLNTKSIAGAASTQYFEVEPIDPRTYASSSTPITDSSQKPFARGQITDITKHDTNNGSFYLKIQTVGDNNHSYWNNMSAMELKDRLVKLSFNDSSSAAQGLNNALWAVNWADSKTMTLYPVDDSIAAPNLSVETAAAQNSSTNPSVTWEFVSPIIYSQAKTKHSGTFHYNVHNDRVSFHAGDPEIDFAVHHGHNSQPLYLYPNGQNRATAETEFHLKNFYATSSVLEGETNYPTGAGTSSLPSRFAKISIDGEDRLLSIWWAGNGRLSMQGLDPSVDISANIYNSENKVDIEFINPEFYLADGTAWTGSTVVSGDPWASNGVEIKTNDGQALFLYNNGTNSASNGSNTAGFSTISLNIDTNTYQSSFKPFFSAHPVGNEFQINTNKSNDQQYPVIASLKDGGFVVVWNSNNQDGSDYGVFGQRFNSSGTAIGGEFQVNTHTAFHQTDSRVTGTGDGGFLVTWTSTDSAQDGSGYGVFAQRFNSSGTKVGAEFQVNTTTSSHQLHSNPTSLTGGGFVITWASNEQDGSGKGVFGQLYDASGVAVGGEFQINTHTNADQMLPRVTSLSDGGFVATWSSDQQDGSGFGVFGQRYDATGSVIGSEFKINTSTNSNQFVDSATVLSNGDIIVSWSNENLDGSGYGVYGQRFDSSGSAIGNEFRINTYIENNQGGVSVSGLSDGGFVAAWSSQGQDASGYGVYGRRFDAQGNQVGNEFRINTLTADDQLNPAVTSLADGGFAVTWQSITQDGEGWEIRGQRFSGSVDAPENTSGDITSISYGGSEWAGKEMLVNFSGKTPAGAASDLTLRDGDPASANADFNDRVVRLIIDDQSSSAYKYNNQLFSVNKVINSSGNNGTISLSPIDNSVSIENFSTEFSAGQARWQFVVPDLYASDGNPYTGDFFVGNDGFSNIASGNESSTNLNIEGTPSADELYLYQNATNNALEKRGNKISQLSNSTQNGVARFQIDTHQDAPASRPSFIRFVSDDGSLGLDEAIFKVEWYGTYNEGSGASISVTAVDHTIDTSALVGINANDVRFEVISPELYTSDGNAYSGDTNVYYNNHLPWPHAVIATGQSPDAPHQTLYIHDYGSNVRDVSSTATENIGKVIGSLDKALSNVDSKRASYGATLNRLQFALDNLANIALNTEDARSRITDTNYASETTALATESIVSRAANAMVAQANQQPRAVHHLLGRELSKSLRSEHNLYS